LRAIRWLAIALAVAICTPAAAQATLPGANGEILYEGAGGLSAFDPETGESRILFSGSHQGLGVAGDGRTLAFSRWVALPGNEDPGGTISVASADGTWEREITYRHLSPLGVWTMSPHGETIVYSGDRDGVGLFGISSDGSSRWQITSTVNDLEPAFSPSGATLAFTRIAQQECTQRTPADAVWVTDVAGLGARPLVRIRGERAWAPTFMPNGRRVVYLRTHDRVLCDDDEDTLSRTAVHSIRLDGTGDRLLTKPSYRYFNNPTPSPDGKRILLERKLRLFVMSLRGRRKLHPVPRSPNIGGLHAWAPAP
jgi:hypothetical protein